MSHVTASEVGYRSRASAPQRAQVSFNFKTAGWPRPVTSANHGAKGVTLQNRANQLVNQQCTITNKPITHGVFIARDWTTKACQGFMYLCMSGVCMYLCIHVCMQHRSVLSWLFEARRLSATSSACVLLCSTQQWLSSCTRTIMSCTHNLADRNKSPATACWGIDDLSQAYNYRAVSSTSNLHPNGFLYVWIREEPRPSRAYWKIAIDTCRD